MFFEITFATHSASQQCNNEVHSVAFVATRVCLLHGMVAILQCVCRFSM